ncbi:hypothetical protein FSP39_023541 [Pinctada imbricata]|uniref:Ion transport domain-containing protein n=1 Tax=Pinctada imbricata TaxID=66713 RepID=A0AA88XY51_PINIB|nr:hypothetical protein FSP39_023541 [Pinctada imbricata]
MLFRRSYNLYNKFYLRWLLYFFLALDMVLALIEKPARDGWLVPYWLTVIDIICYLIWDNLQSPSHAIRWSRPLRPLFMINFPDGKQVRRAFRNIRRTLPEILNVLILFIMMVLLFALLALKLFSRRTLVYPNGRAYFKNYWESIWDLYVLVTTANNPDVMMPAYDYSSYFALFFIAYTIICLYIFMSIVLAAIYYSYRKNLKNEVKAAVYMKRKKLSQAFDILKSEKDGRFVITFPVWCALMKKVIPSRSRSHIDLLVRVLDIDGDNAVRKSQFLKLADLLELPLTEVKDRQTFLEKMVPNIYNSKASSYLKFAVRHWVFRWTFYILIFGNAWFIAFDVDEADWAFLSVFMVEIILKMYVLGPKEFFKKAWNTFDFIVIGAAVIVSSIEAIEEASYEEFQLLDYLLVLRVLRLFKIFGSIKRFKVILQTVANIIPSITTYGAVIYVTYYFFAIIGMELFGGLIKFYGPADTGHPFCGNDALNNTYFAMFHYCNNNFNDMIRSLVVLFELMVVNQWHDILYFINVTNVAVRAYFFAFHMWCVIIILNIFIAFVLEAFMLEYTIQKAGKLESYVERKIKDLGLGLGQTYAFRKNTRQADDLELVENEELPHMNVTTEEEDDSDTDSIPDLSHEKGLRFHLQKKSRKKVEVLLQQMFEGEIDPNDEGPDNQDDLYAESRPRRLTLDTVT